MASLLQYQEKTRRIRHGQNDASAEDSFYFIPILNFITYSQNVTLTLQQHKYEFGEVPVAGMEDFHAILKMLRQNDKLRWGMIGRASPLKWDVDFSHGSEREKNHLIKVARQYAVMKEWAGDIFPNLSFENVMDMMFVRGHQD